MRAHLRSSRGDRRQPWRRRLGGIGLLSLAVGLAFAASAQQAAAIRRSERRARCASFDRLRRPFFGDLHVHTSYSWDAHIFGNADNDPAAAYEFARGAEKRVLFDAAPGGVLPIRLRRPLDFAAVTDHSEYFGETRICTTPGAPGYQADHCRIFRGDDPPPLGLTAFQYWGLNLTSVALGEISACAVPGACEASAATVWQQTRQAAEDAYDRSRACTFTSFVGYEYTGSSGGYNGHRNVIFRNDSVPDAPTSSFETGGTDAPALWEALQRTCLDGVERCDVLTIPHNANLSGGTMFPDPETAERATTRAFFEPLAEIAQIKGSSECRFDRTVGLGAGTTDEACAWEQRTPQMQSPVPGVDYVLPIQDYPRGNMLRNVLKRGLQVERRLGVNPFKFGFIGSTDVHNGTPGAVEEDALTGSHGSVDDSLLERVRGDHIEDNPGSLAVLWAEENSRDALFEAMRRREAYATSGTRPVVRFFGGWSYDLDHCEKRNQIRRAYALGVPMGSDLPRRRRIRRAPRFYVSAMKDPGTEGHPGTDLQRIQIVKGWIDAGGEAHERVVDVAGDSARGAFVDESTCEAREDGFADLCVVWEDPDFDPAQQAFYYARVLENRSCRWHTRVCKQLGIDPFAPDCAARAGADLANCCVDAPDHAFLSPVTQERAWTSPIWYRPATRRGARR